MSLAVVVDEVDEQVFPDAALEAGRGHALFTHNWTLGDAWSLDGDGLGPRFNATSCIACHAQGGIGGSGAGHHDVLPFPRDDLDPGGDDLLTSMLRRAQLGSKGATAADAFGIGPRNATALFGAGLIDAIEDDVITENALRRHPRFPKIKGQVARTPEGRVGRFGWKGDVPLLGEFVARACAIEVGLDVPGAPQGGLPAKGHDLELEDLAALTSFVASLPPPERAERSSSSRAGERIFEEIGCVVCHQETLGDVEGIYSDLLLHDMGPALADGAGTWGAPVTSLAARTWRTPPLWGARDSGPWLHDGRARDLDQAIAHHGGEALESALRWRALTQTERLSLRAFLETLVAPGAA